MGTLHESPEWRKIPRAELDALRSFIENQESREITFIKWLDGGYSGSPVALIDDKLSGRSSKERILKFCSQGQSEVQGIDRAYELAPDAFKARHLVRKHRDFPLQDWRGMLMEIAGGDLSSPSLDEYATDERLPEICATLIESLLADWNEGDRELKAELSTGQFLRRVVGPQKIEPDGSLHGFASRSGIDWDAPWVERAGWDRLLRNPFGMLAEGYGEKLSAVVGIGHGDLSVFNVLIPVQLPGFQDIQPAQYWLIDYGASSSEYPLTRDPMYLLLSLATRHLKRIRTSSEFGRSLIKLLAFSRDSVDSFDIAGYKRVFDGIVKTGYEWARSKERGHHWFPQSQLSVIGCALTFIGRRIDSLEIAETDDWLFDLAAVAATEYCSKYEKESIPSPLRLPPPRPPVTDLQARPGSVSALIEQLDRAAFSQEHWSQLELGTRDLREMLSETYELKGDSARRIRGLIAELRRVLSGATKSVAPPAQVAAAARRAEDLRERLLTLLRS